MADDQTDPTQWRDGGVPVSTRFDDPYFSLDNGLAETRHVFLAGNDLPGRFRPGFHIAELGFGTGLNLAVAWQAWREAGVPGALRFTSFEAYPMAAADAARALAGFAGAAPFADEIAAMLARGDGRISTPDLDFTLVTGDARTTLPQWTGQADAWFLDGFAPAKNPELWEAPLLVEVARHTAPGGSFATYSAAGEVRRRLATAGFAVMREPGYGRKRHMSVGRMQ